MFVLDTNTVIYFFKGAGGVAERLLATPPSEVALPAVVVYELEVGVAKSVASEKRRAQLDAFVAAARVLPFGPAEARAAARIRVELERDGQPIAPLDLLVAGTAAAHGATLVTRNVREFGRVAGLAVTNWHD
jgi:tRNA(fMet)-specific endonuclease VapC